MSAPVDSYHVFCSSPTIHTLHYQGVAKLRGAGIDRFSQDQPDPRTILTRSRARATGLPKTILTRSRTSADWLCVREEAVPLGTGAGESQTIPFWGAKQGLGYSEINPVFYLCFFFLNVYIVRINYSKATGRYYVLLLTPLVSFNL
jgi:hypothetical protein